ncbi:MAG: hypothetical protein WBE72_13820 [Terracidiphilus sp.]
MKSELSLVMLFLPALACICQSPDITNGGRVQNLAATTAHLANNSGLRFVDGVNSWGTDTTITAAYSDACLNGGTLEISQYYKGAETIPFSCASLGVDRAAQPFLRVVDDRNGPSAVTGKINLLEFGADPTATASSNNALLQGALPASLYARAFGSNLCHPIYVPSGDYRLNEAVIPSTYQSCPEIEGSDHIHGTRFFYGGTGGPGSYMLQFPILSDGGINNLDFVGSNPGSAVSSVAQNGLSFAALDSGSDTSNWQVQDFYGDAFTMGTPTGPTGDTNSYFHHFRTDAVGGYAIKMWMAPVADGFIADLSDYTTDNNAGSGSFASYLIAHGYAPGDGSHLAGYGSGDLFCNNCNAYYFDVSNVRDEENLPTLNVGNADQGRFFFNNDSPRSFPSLSMHNFALAGSPKAPHPLVSSAAGRVAFVMYGNNYMYGVSGLYKNRLTQQEYGDSTTATAPVWSFGKSPLAVQGPCYEDQCFDVVPVSMRSQNFARRHVGDWFYRHQEDFVPGAMGPFDVVVSPVNGGRGAMRAHYVLSNAVTVTANPSYTPAHLATVTAASGGSIEGTGNCTLTNFSGGFAGASALATFAAPGSWAGATFVVTAQGDGAAGSPTSVTATLGNGTATCSGTATLTITTAASRPSTYANLTGFDPATKALHIGDNLTIINSGNGGSGSTDVQVACVDMTGSGTECAGLSTAGAVVYAAPGCLASGSCPSAGAATVEWTQVTLSNFGLEANRTASTSLAGTACPYAGDYVWNDKPAPGSPMGYACSSALRWVAMPNYPAGGERAAADSTHPAGPPPSGAVKLASLTRFVPTHAADVGPASAPGAVNDGSCGLLSGCVERWTAGGSSFAVLGNSVTQAAGATSISVHNALAFAPVMVESDSAAVAGDSAGWFSGQAYYGARQPAVSFGVAYAAPGNYSSPARIQLGLVGDSCSPRSMAASDTPPCSYAQIQLSTTRGDATYMCVTDSGSGRPQVTPIGIAPSSFASPYSLEPMSITFGDGSVTCTVNGISVTNTANLPLPTTVFLDMFLNTTLTDAATALRMNGVQGASQNGTF